MVEAHRQSSSSSRNCRFESDYIVSSDLRKRSPSFCSFVATTDPLSPFASVVARVPSLQKVFRPFGVHEESRLFPSTRPIPVVSLNRTTHAVSAFERLVRALHDTTRLWECSNPSCTIP